MRCRVYLYLLALQVDVAANNNCCYVGITIGSSSFSTGIQGQNSTNTQHTVRNSPTSLRWNYPAKFFQGSFDTRAVM